MTLVRNPNIKHRGKFSVVGACEGAIAGLVGITPAAGFVSVWLVLVLNAASIARTLALRVEPP
jgi:ammonia channel protein AmtB